METEASAAAACPRAVGIQGVGYYLGERRPIAELPRFADDPAALAAFKSRGFGHYTRSDIGIAEQAVRAARATLRAAGKSAGDIDAVVVGIVELRWYTGIQEEIGGELLRSLGFGNIHLVGLSLGGCTNYTGLLRVARSLIVSEGYRNVLVIETNKCRADGADRPVTPDVSIFSDGAASCIVTTDAPEFAIRGLAQVTTPVEPNPNVGSGAVVAHRVSAARLVFDRALRQAGVRTRDIKLFLMPNHGTQMLTMYADRLRVPKSRVHTDNLFWLAHAWSADTIINLHSHCHYNDVAPGERFMIISWAEYNFAAVVLEALVAKKAQGVKTT